MDGNFSHKRAKCAENSPAPFQLKGIDNLWGRVGEIEAAEEAQEECVRVFCNI